MTALRIAIGLAALATAFGVRPPPPDALLIRGARVFDGTGAAAVIEDVLVRGERIAAIGPHLRTGGAKVIDARGLTLLPGLHDLHIHGRAPAIEAAEDLGKAYASYLIHGVTAVNDYSVSGEMLGPIRAMTGAGVVPAPRLTLAIRLGVPGGHGTEFGWGNGFTLEASTPRAAHRAMAQALAYRPDMIKVFADGWRYGRAPDLNSINLETLSAIVADAHAAGLPVVTHTVTLQGAKVAAAAGVDAVGHGVGDAPVDDALIAAMRAHGTGYIATLSAFEPLGARTLLPAEAASLRPEERAAEAQNGPGPIPAYEARRWAIMRDNIARLHAAGVAIGVGTDAGVIGVYHGAAAIREIRLLAAAGLTPREALAAATGVSAAIMHRAGPIAEGGRIAIGARADLLLTGGRPDEWLDDLYDVRRVWVGGREVPLARLRKLVDGPASSPVPMRVMTGPIDTGARADGRTDLDTLPVESSDAGVDHSQLTVVRRAGGRLLVARFGAGAHPYAQWALPLTPGGVQIADARGFTGVAFSVRGDGAATLLLDSYGLREEAWFRAPMVAEDTAREVRIAFADLRSPDAPTLDLAQLRAVVVRMEGQPGGRSWLEIGKVRFYR